MKICVNVLIEYDSLFENVIDFMETLRKTKGDFSVCVVNNSPRRFIELENCDWFDDINIIWNNIDVGFVTSVNQLLNYSSKYDYSFFINSKYALVVKDDWMEIAIKDLGDEFLGGHIFPVKMTNSEKIQKILYSISSTDLSWLSKWTNRYMVLPCINRNAFLIRNSGLNSIKIPNSKYCDDSSYGLALTMAFMEGGMGPVSLKSIYSSDLDAHRHDIFSVIKQGAGLINPVVIDSVRNRLKN